MKKSIILLIMVFSFLLPGLKQACGNEKDYRLAKNAVNSGNREFAFMHFSSVLKNDSNPLHLREALFATGEYYFLNSNYTDAFGALKEFVKNYPDSEMQPIAFFYLLKISQYWKNDHLAESIEKQIIGLNRVVLLFKETREYNFKSPMGMDYKLIYYIDRIEFYSNGKLQAQIFY